MGTGYRSEGLTTYFSYAATYMCAKLIKGAKQRRIILVTFCISISLLAITVYLQTTPGVLTALGKIGENLIGNGINIAKRSAIFLNRNHFAYMLTLCLLALAGLSLYASINSHILILALFVFNLWALIKNNTFGCYLAVLVGLLFLTIISYFINPKMIKRALILLLLFGALTIISESKGVGTITKDFDTMIDDVVDPTQSDRPGSGRFTLWNKAIECIMERPVFGYGPEGLHYIYIGRCQLYFHYKFVGNYVENVWITLHTSHFLLLEVLRHFLPIF